MWMKATTSCSEEARGGAGGPLGSDAAAGSDRVGPSGRARVSEPARGTARLTARPTLALLALLGAASLWARPPAGEPPAPRFGGEYGLFVRHGDEDLEVHWLTEEHVEGTLRVYRADERIAIFETPASRSHVATVDPGDASELELEYGALDDPDGLERTRVWLEPVRRVREPAFEGSDSVFIVGDVHGEFDALARLLHRAGLIDADLRWSGGRSRLVFLGDLFDRGPDVTRLLWFLYRLEREAEAAGGRLHVVLGNHEVMVMTGDLRYVSGKEGLVAFRHQVEYSEMFDPRRSVLGRWLAGKPVLMRMDDVLLAHGGVSPAYADYTLRQLQDSLARFMDEELFLLWDDGDEALSRFAGELAEAAELDSAGVVEALVRRHDFFFSPESILWYRGLVNSDTLDAHLDRVLERHDSRLHVVGHSVVHRIQARYGGRVIAVDVQPPATELLLLVREKGEDGWRRLRLPTVGEPEPVGVGEPVTSDTAAAEDSPGGSDPEG